MNAFTVRTVDFRRQALPHRSPGVVAGPAQALGGVEGPFLRGTAVARPAHTGMDADRLVQIEVHMRPHGYRFDVGADRSAVTVGARSRCSPCGKPVRQGSPPLALPARAGALVIN